MMTSVLMTVGSVIDGVGVYEWQGKHIATQKDSGRESTALAVRG